MAAMEIIVKKYVVRLSDDEHERLAILIRKGSSSAHRLLKERILLKADVSEAGEGWSDNQIIEALEHSRGDGLHDPLHKQGDLRRPTRTAAR